MELKELERRNTIWMSHDADEVFTYVPENITHQGLISGVYTKMRFGMGYRPSPIQLGNGVIITHDNVTYKGNLTNLSRAVGVNANYVCIKLEDIFGGTAYINEIPVVSFRKFWKEQIALIDE